MALLLRSMLVKGNAVERTKIERAEPVKLSTVSVCPVIVILYTPFPFRLWDFFGNLIRSRPIRILVLVRKYLAPPTIFSKGGNGRENELLITYQRCGLKGLEKICSMCFWLILDIICNIVLSKHFLLDSAKRVLMRIWYGFCSPRIIYHAFHLQVPSHKSIEPANSQQISRRAPLGSQVSLSLCDLVSQSPVVSIAPNRNPLQGVGDTLSLKELPCDAM